MASPGSGVLSEESPDRRRGTPPRVRLERSWRLGCGPERNNMDTKYLVVEKSTIAKTSIIFIKIYDKYKKNLLKLY